MGARFLSRKARESVHHTVGDWVTRREAPWPTPGFLPDRQQRPGHTGSALGPGGSGVRCASSDVGTGYLAANPPIRRTSPASAPPPGDPVFFFFCPFTLVPDARNSAATVETWDDVPSLFFGLRRILVVPRSLVSDEGSNV